MPNKFLKVEVASDSDSKQLCSIWKEAFSLDDDYLDHLFTNLFPCGKILTLKGIKSSTLDEQILSTFVLHPITFISEEITLNGYYISYVATPKVERGNNYFSQLLNLAKDFYHDKDFLLIRPAEDWLDNFYHRLGFTTPIYNPTFSNFYRKSYSSTPHLGNNNFSESNNIGNIINLLYKPCFVWDNSIYNFIQKDAPLNFATSTLLSELNEAFKKNHTDIVDGKYKISFGEIIIARLKILNKNVNSSSFKNSLLFFTFD